MALQDADQRQRIRRCAITLAVLALAIFALFIGMTFLNR